jgi:broad specificity phosphatase PhoE
MRSSRFNRSALVLSLALAAARLSAQPTTVILVRHAEKAASPATDPPLTSAGEQRAKDLAAALADARVGTIITTQYQRTRATAKPLAQAAGKTPIELMAVPELREHAEEVAATVRSRPAGETVLVVGHSNTLPVIIAALGGPQIPNICETQYGGMFILELSANGPSRLIRATYGAADPPDTSNCNRTMR